MKLLIFLLIVNVVCTPAYTQQIVIPADKRAAYYRTKDRAERYNKVVEQKREYLECGVSRETLIIKSRKYDVYEIQKIPVKYAKSCQIIGNRPEITYEYPKDPGFFGSFWTPTKVFIIGVVTGLLSGFGLGRL
jgi:hypothetical protein